MSDAPEDWIPWARERLEALEREMAGRIVGQHALVRGTIASLVAGGHVLLQGVPGLGKTLLVRTLGEALELRFARVQLTPDLMPADIVGTRVAAEDDTGTRHFHFEPGPVFTQLLLADELNRATPKTQSALLEAMEEGAVTVGRRRHRLPEPFMVLATQNPIEMEGTYPLPEAQLDRFLLRLLAPYPSAEELGAIADLALEPFAAEVAPVMTAADVGRVRAAARSVVVAPHVKDYAVRLVLATHPSTAGAPGPVARYVRHGASPRGLIGLLRVARAHAMLAGRLTASFADLAAAAGPVLAHRLLLGYEAAVDGIEDTDVVASVVAAVPEVPA